MDVLILVCVGIGWNDLIVGESTKKKEDWQVVKIGKEDWQVVKVQITLTWYPQ